MKKLILLFAALLSAQASANVFALVYGNAVINSIIYDGSSLPSDITNHCDGASGPACQCTADTTSTVPQPSITWTTADDCATFTAPVVPPPPAPADDIGGVSTQQITQAVQRVTQATWDILSYHLVERNLLGYAGFYGLNLGLDPDQSYDSDFPFKPVLDMVHFIPDQGNVAAVMQNYGPGGEFGTTPIFLMRYASTDGEVDHPTHVSDNDGLGTIGWAGYGATGWPSGVLSAQIGVNAIGEWDDTTQHWAMKIGDGDGQGLTLNDIGHFSFGVTGISADYHGVIDGTFYATTSETEGFGQFLANHAIGLATTEGVTYTIEQPDSPVAGNLSFKFPNNTPFTGGVLTLLNPDGASEWQAPKAQTPIVFSSAGVIASETTIAAGKNETGDVITPISVNAVASTFTTCTSNPNIFLIKCGSGDASCASPTIVCGLTTIASAGTFYQATALSMDCTGSVGSGEYWKVELEDSDCAAFSVSGSINYSR